MPAQTMLMSDNCQAANMNAAGGETVARNLITDVAGLRVGHADDHRLASGSTVILFDKPAVAGVDVRGGGPGSRDTELLDPAMTVECIDAITLSGGSAFGLDAASGVQAWLREQGRGFAVAGMVVPIVPGAVLFDLDNGGDKNWGRFAPYRDLGYAATAAASTDFGLGSVGAGLGATTVNLKGGFGSASATTRDGHTVGAAVAVNAVGSVTVGAGPSFWAAAFEVHREFGGRGWPSPMPADALALRTKGGPLASTTIALVATDATLTKAQAKRLAVMAQDGFARAIYPVHTPLDGDTVFAASTGRRPLTDPIYEFAELGALAANVLARAVARGVYEATALPFRGALPSWRDRFGG
jgi:D-aminopeptidase